MIRTWDWSILIFVVFLLAGCQAAVTSSVVAVESPTPKASETGSEEQATLAPTGVDPACAKIEEAIRIAANRRRSANAPVSPNGTRLVGALRCLRQVESGTMKIQPSMTLYLAAIEIVDPRDMEGLANRLAGKAGETIVVISKQPVAGEAGQAIELEVEFRGDEFGGAYWTMN